MEWLAVKSLTLVRAHQVCEVCGALFADDVHHRQPRGMGGVHGAAARVANSAANLLALCRGCHDGIESNREEAQGLGRLVTHPLHSAFVPVLIKPIYGRGWYFLTGDFGYQRAEEWQVKKAQRVYGLT